MHLAKENITHHVVSIVALLIIYFEICIVVSFVSMPLFLRARSVLPAYTFLPARSRSETFGGKTNALLSFRL
jgi:hypothetical protein